MSVSVIDPAIARLADAAGILCRWEDAAGRRQHVAEPVLRELLGALGLACSSASDIRDSLRRVAVDRVLRDGDLVVCDAGSAPVLRIGKIEGSSRGLAQGVPWTLELESGGVVHGVGRQADAGQLLIDPVTEPGYHTLHVDAFTFTLAVVPTRCPAMPTQGAERPWGLVAQVYSLPYAGNAHLPSWAQGATFSAVEVLAREAAQHGAAALALSPVHAMFSADSDRYSPYSPSSRLFLNVCYADPARVLGRELVQEALKTHTPALSEHHRDPGQLLDWPAITTARLQLLRSVFHVFLARAPEALRTRFADFCQSGGEDLQRHAIYEALHGHFSRTLGPGHGWQDWAPPLQNPDNSAVAEFASQHDGEVRFHLFAQWLAFEGLQQAQTAAQDAGMACGLISDLAIGTDPRGSHAWSLRDDMLKGVTVGAPPDVYQADGQNWGLTAFSPRGLRHNAYAAFIATMRANLRCAGGVRVDHVAGLERLWLVPDGAHARDGAYLRYPRRELLGLLTLEAWRHQTVVIGENLGTVSDALNRALTDRGVLGTSVLWFERDETAEPNAVPGFRLPAQWSTQQVAMPTTHDLPTVHGWWQERDIYWRVLLGQVKPHDEKHARHERSLQRAQLWDALLQAGCRPEAPVTVPETTPLNEVLSFVARTPAPLALFPLEDLLGLLDQPNMPGGQARQGWVGHPNWLQQLPVPVQTVFRSDGVPQRVDAIRRARSAS